MILLPLTYLGPVQLYCRYYQSEKILIEQHDSYQKQSYRNRCDIYAANGRLSMSIPVKHDSGKRLKVRETKIDYATDWRRLHWKGIESSYNSSPYFEYYRDFFEPYYRKKFVFLVDLCMQLNDEVLKILNISEKPELTTEYYLSSSFPQGRTVNTDLTNVFYPTPAFSESLSVKPDLTDVFYPTPALPKGEGVVGSQKSITVLDLRSLIHPKIKIEDDRKFRVIEYTQVFSQKHGFISNLSILDLIFNMGPESGRVLNSSLD